MNNELPKNWEITNLGQVSEIILGQSPPSSSYNENDNGLPFYQGKLEFGKIFPTPQKWCTAPKKIAEKEDVLISVRAPVGPTNICHEKSCIGRGLAAIRPMGGIGNLFILYLIHAFENEIAGRGTGTTFNAITGDQLKEFEIPLPPLEEQKRIVAKIEELFTKLEAGVEGLKKVKAQLRRYRQAVLKYAFEGKFTEEWRRENKGKIEPASALLERVKEERKKKLGKKYKELPLVDDESLPGLPKGWAWTRVGMIRDIIQYGYTAKASDKKIGPKFLRITDIQNNCVNWDEVPYCKINEQEIEKYMLYPGDLVFARTGATVGKSYLIGHDAPKAIFASYLIRIKLASKIDKKCIYNFFQSQLYWEQIHKRKIGIGQPNVNGNTLAQIHLPLAPIEEQRKIVEEIERRLSAAREAERVVDQSLRQAERLRQSILKRAFEGKLVPQDPTDEPAEKLLERIKAEKAKQKGNKHKGRRSGHLRSAD